MSAHESPELLARIGGGELGADDLRVLCGAATPHFALQLSERLRAMIATLAAEDPLRRAGEAEIERLRALALGGAQSDERAGSDLSEYERPLPSLS